MYRLALLLLSPYQSLSTHPNVSYYFLKKGRKRLDDFTVSFLLGRTTLPDLSTGSHNAPPATGDTLFSVVAQDSLKNDMQIIIPYEHIAKNWTLRCRVI